MVLPNTIHHSEIKGKNNMIYSAIKQFSKASRHGLFNDDELEEWA